MKANVNRWNPSMSDQTNRSKGRLCLVLPSGRQLVNYAIRPKAQSLPDATRKRGKLAANVVSIHRNVRELNRHHIYWPVLKSPSKSLKFSWLNEDPH